SRTVRVPAHIIDAINKVAKIQRQFMQKQGREATVAELAQRLSTPKEKIEALSKISQFGVSLDKPVDDDETSFIGDFIYDEKTASPSHAAGVSLLGEKLEEALAVLTKREEKVLRLRFGLGDGCPRTLEEVGQIFNITRERVRQIEAKALKKLRHPVRLRRFEPLRDLLQ
ncbi:sigma-70 family RNA polymerase sigma factor, partial [candidate division WOR-3 bacterium]|nr:sigma-70 family RNA polymerase sigma factor [candidate division WOR-3 bacterium]